MCFNKALICNFINVRYFFLKFCEIYAKDKEARVNYGHVNNFATIYEPLKMLFSHFPKIDLSNLKMTFAKSLIKKEPFFDKFYYFTKFYFIISKLKRCQILNVSNFFSIL